MRSGFYPQDGSAFYDQCLFNLIWHKLLLPLVATYIFLIEEDSQVYWPNGFADCLSADGTIIPGSWRENIEDKENNLALVADPDVDAGKSIRNLLRDYVNSPQGSVPWPIPI